MMRVNHRETDLENHDRGLDYDLPRLLHRRGMLKLVAGVGLAGAGLITLGACGSEATTGEASSPSGSRPAGGQPEGGPGGGAPESTQTSDTANGELPEETGGPYPGDGSNGANVLNQSGIVRSDITTSFGSSTTKAEGVPLNITMTINDYANSKAPLAGGAVYVWHCDREGRYSLYSQGVSGENYLRGVQETDGRGQVRFTTDLSRVLLRPLAAHPFRGVSQPRQSYEQREQDRHIAAGPARGHLSSGLRDQRIRAEPQQHEPRQPGQ